MTAPTLLLVCVVACGFAGCGADSGACLTGNGICAQSPPRSFDSSTCVAPWVWNPGKTCADIGYTQACPTEKAGCYCMASNPYCP
jgi:hypothetical protein